MFLQAHTAENYFLFLIGENSSHTFIGPQSSANCLLDTHTRDQKVPLEMCVGCKGDFKVGIKEVLSQSSGVEAGIWRRENTAGAGLQASAWPG